MNLPSWASRPIPAAAATAAPPLLPHDGGIGAGLLAALLDEFDLGVIVCDAHARLRLANQAGWRELDAGRWLLLDGSEVLAPCQPQLRLALRQAAASGRRELLALDSSAQRRLVYVLPLAAGSGGGGLPGAGHAALLLGREPRCSDLAAQLLARQFGLTAAERDVLLALCEGDGAASIARRRSVALSTVRTQIASLRSKLGVASIAGAVALLATMPPLAGALRRWGGGAASALPAREQRH